jgi:hypothetical protein
MIAKSNYDINPLPAEVLTTMLSTSRCSIIETHFAKARRCAAVVADAGKPYVPGVHTAESDFGIVGVRGAAVGLGKGLCAAELGPVAAVRGVLDGAILQAAIRPQIAAAGEGGHGAYRQTGAVFNLKCDQKVVGMEKRTPASAGALDLKLLRLLN